MKITGGFKSKIEARSSKIGNSQWLVNDKNKRLTPKFKTINHKKLGFFTELRTNKGDFVYNACQNELLYANPNGDDFIGVWKVGEHLYAIEYGRGDCRTCKLYTETGSLIRILTQITKLENGRIAAEKVGKWGFIDDDANDVIPFIYYDVTSFNKQGYAVVYSKPRRVGESTYATVIDKEGNEQFTALECLELKFASKTHFEISRGFRKNGIIDIRGKEIIPAIYNTIVPKGDFYIVSYTCKKWGLYDNNGKMLFEPIYDEIIETPEKFVVRDFAKLEIQKTKEILK